MFLDIIVISRFLFPLPPSYPHSYSAPLPPLKFAPPPFPFPHLHPKLEPCMGRRRRGRLDGEGMEQLCCW